MICIRPPLHPPFRPKANRSPGGAPGAPRVMVFWLATTGLPVRENFANARLLQLAYTVYDPDWNVVEQASHIVTPEVSED